MEICYFDNSATTIPYDEAVTAVSDAMKNRYGNPSSLHTLGFDAEKLINDAKSVISALIGCNAKELYITSGGTESNNLAISGAAEALKRRGNEIVTTAVEHPSVINCCKRLEALGFTVRYVKPVNGVITSDSFAELITEKTVLVSVMAINNETGEILPTGSIREIIKKSGSPALFHIDAVQAAGKQTNLLAAQPDLMSISAHKMHGPKGIGALFVKKGVRIIPQILGGGQQNGMRSGTENTASAAGFAAAARLTKQNLESDIRFVCELKKQFEDGLIKVYPQAVINSPHNSSPFISNISLVGYKSEVLLHSLESLGVMVSAGSACSSHSDRASHVLTAMGLPREITDSALRISFSSFNTPRQVEILLSAIKTAVGTLIRS